MTNKSILSFRRQIDSVDKQIMKLCLSRIRISKKIWELKIKDTKNLKDRTREKVILRAFEKKLLKATHKSKIKKFVRELIALNPDY